MEDREKRAFERLVKEYQDQIATYEVATIKLQDNQAALLKELKQAIIELEEAAKIVDGGGFHGMAEIFRSATGRKKVLIDLIEQNQHVTEDTCLWRSEL